MNGLGVDRRNGYARGRDLIIVDSTVRHSAARTTTRALALRLPRLLGVTFRSSWYGKSSLVQSLASRWHP
jgi:hypothetical protein